MPLVPIDNVGSVGVVKDRPPHELPPEAWSDAGNVRFYDGKAVKFLGHAQVFGTPGIAPYFALGVPTQSVYLWLYAGLLKAYGFDGTTHTDITRASGDYGMATSAPWTGGLLGGIPIINQPGDDPQMWNPPALATPLADLSNWPASTTARVMKPFRNHLVALDIRKASGNFGHMVKWSHPADPGTVPTSWDEADATVDAGEYELDDTYAGVLLDQLPLRSINVLYKEASTWGMQHIGGRFIFRFWQISGESGILSTHCVSLLGNGRQHFVATGDDVVVHDGQQLQSVAGRIWRRWLARNIDTTNYANSFTVTNSSQKEAWLCFPEVGATWPTKVFSWNWENGTTGVREIADVALIVPGVVDETPSTDTWDGGPAIDWQGDTEVWGERVYNPQEQHLLMLDPVSTKFFQADSTEQLDGVDMAAFVERIGLAVAGRDRQGNPKVDPTVRKLVTEVWPRASGGPFFVRVGSHETPDAEVNWSAPQTFDPATDEKINVTAEGKYIGVRFEALGARPWELHGYGLNIEPIGKY